MLVEFTSVIDAVRCAAEVQREMARRNADLPADSRIEFRVGIHQGDIIAEDGDIFGDGINLDARLEGLAEPGGICVAGRVQSDAAGRVDVKFKDLGEQTLKNIARPVHAFAVEFGPRASRPPAGPDAAETAAVRSAPQPLPSKPSLAVLSFTNMSGDPEQEYLAAY